MKFKKMIHPTLNMKSLYCIQCIDLYCHIIVFLNTRTNKNGICVQLKKLYYRILFMYLFTSLLIVCSNCVYTCSVEKLIYHHGLNPT